MQAIRGTKDLFLDDSKHFEAVIDVAKNLAKLYNFQTLFTPIFEATEVFKRSLGEETDVVSKEMYEFESKGGESLCLRPEFTAGVARAFISNGWQQHLPLKFFSYGPLFRYERPQKGRQRQFHQINFEYYGNATPLADGEIIILAERILSALGIENSELNINSLGDIASRENYIAKLVEYLKKYENELSAESKIRLEKNPLRILDSKDENDRKILVNAPKMVDCLNDESKKFIDELLEFLNKNLKTKIIYNNNIVRGLDYYNHSVFEFISNSDEMGTQNTILAGGRYDGLVKKMGGPETPAVGFAAGIERLMMLAKFAESKKKLVAVIADDNAKAYEAAEGLRSLNIPCEVIFSGNFKKKMQKADKIHASDVLFVFEDSMEIKNLASGEQKKIKSLTEL